MQTHTHSQMYIKRDRNLPEQISPYTFTKELIINFPLLKVKQRLSHTKNQASRSTAPATVVPLFMKQRRRTRKSMRRNWDVIPVEVAASALFAEKIAKQCVRQWQPTAEVQQPDTSLWWEAACFVGGGYHHTWLFAPNCKWDWLTE